MGSWDIDHGKRTTRPPAQRERILADLRSQILSGHLGPGDSVPSRAKLRSRYKVSPVTIQRAMDRLATEGFIVAGPTGTTVAPRLPHLARYGVVLTNRDTKDHPWSRFHHAILHAAALLEKELDIEVPTHYSGGAGGQDDRGFQLLQHAVASQSVAGLLLLHPFYLLNTTLLSQKNVPVVKLDSPHAPEIPALKFDTTDYIRRALDHFASLDRRRLGVLTAGFFWRDKGDAITSAATPRGAQLRPQWIHRLPLEQPQWPRNVTRLLFASRVDRPDALLIADDNLVEAAVDGLLDAGVLVPEDVAVLGHCNFPDRPNPSVPIAWIGYDAREILRQFMAMADDIRHGKAVRDRLIPAQTNTPKVC